VAAVHNPAGSLILVYGLRPNAGKNLMSKQQIGFTLIELVVVIIILGILSAIAIPRYVDLKGSASDAALKGVQAAMASAMSVNYSGCAAMRHTATANRCYVINNCNQVGTIMDIPDGYTVADGPIGAPNGTRKTDCVVNQAGPPVVPGNFTGIRAGT
jgi:MSHA pilin protein MshA